MMMGNFMGGLSRGITDGRTLGKDIVEQDRRKAIEAEVAKTLGTRPVSISNAEGDMRYEAFGKTQDTEFSDSQLSGLRRRQVADIYARNGRQDDALRIWNEEDSSDRANQQMALQQQQFGLQEKTYGINREAADRAAAAEKRKRDLDEQLAAVDARSATARTGAEDSAAFLQEAMQHDIYRKNPGLLREWAQSQLDLNAGNEASRLRERGQIYQTAGGAEGETAASTLRKEAQSLDNDALNKAIAFMEKGDLKSAAIAWNASGKFSGQIPLELRTIKGEKYVSWVDLKTGQVGQAPVAELSEELRKAALEERKIGLDERRVAATELGARAQMAATGAKTATGTTSGNGFKELTPEQHEGWVAAAMSARPDWNPKDPASAQKANQAVMLATMAAAQNQIPVSVALGQLLGVATVALKGEDTAKEGGKTETKTPPDAPEKPQKNQADRRTKELARLEAKYGRGNVPRQEFFGVTGRMHDWARPEDIAPPAQRSPLWQKP